MYAIIKERAVGSALTLCAGQERHRPLFMSTTNAVEIRIFTKKKMEREAYFVLKYQGKSVSPFVTVPAVAAYSDHSHQLVGVLGYLS